MTNQTEQAEGTTTAIKTTPATASTATTTPPTNQTR